MLTWEVMRQNCLSKPWSPAELVAVRHYKPLSSKVRGCLPGPANRWAQPRPFSAQGFGKSQYHAPLNFFWFPQIRWTYSHIFQGLEKTHQIWAGLEKAGTCSYSPSWPDPVQAPGTAWETPQLQSAHSRRGLHKASGCPRLGGLVSANSRAAAGSGALQSPVPSLRDARWLGASHGAATPCTSSGSQHLPASLQCHLVFLWANFASWLTGRTKGLWKAVKPCLCLSCLCHKCWSNEYIMKEIAPA